MVRVRYRTQLDSSTSCEPWRGLSPVIFPNLNSLHAVMDEFRINGVPSPCGVTLSLIEQFPYAPACVECFDPKLGRAMGQSVGASPACNGVSSSGRQWVNWSEQVPHTTVYQAWSSMDHLVKASGITGLTCHGRHDVSWGSRHTTSVMPYHVRHDVSRAS